jgi:hypothetical protein
MEHQNSMNKSIRFIDHAFIRTVSWLVELLSSSSLSDVTCFPLVAAYVDVTMTLRAADLLGVYYTRRPSADTP